jgi:hypothetical protein
MESNIIDDIFGDEKITQSKSDVKQEETKDDVQQDVQETNPEIEKYKKEIEKLIKQKTDTEKWANENRQSNVINQKIYNEAKDKINELAKKLYENSTIFDEEYEELTKVFDRDLDISSDDEQPKNEEAANTPIKKVVDDLKKTFDEFKKWSDEPDLDHKFNAFYKDLELVTDKRFKEIQEYMLSETDPKVLLKYVLDKGTKSFNKLYKPILEKGDALSYVEDLLSENEKLKKELKELRFELDDTENKVYNNSNKPSSYKANKKDVVGDLFGI